VLTENEAENNTAVAVAGSDKRYGCHDIFNVNSTRIHRLWCQVCGY